MACDDVVMVVDGAKTDHKVHVTLADALTEGRGAPEVEITEPEDQNHSRESSEAVVADSGSTNTQKQRTPFPVSIGLKGGGGGGKSTLAQLVAEDSVAEDRAFSEESLPPTEIIAITTTETQPTTSSSEQSIASTPLVSSGPNGSGTPSSVTTLAQLFAEGNHIRVAASSSSPGTETSVILFGRTGSGKSTLAQMLTVGKLDPQCAEFISSSGIRGETKELKNGEGRGWHVVDTPGFGEPKDPHSTVSSEEAERKIRRYIQMIEGTYTHFLYTVMRDRVDELDKKLWKFFLRLFGESINNNFSVVISNASVGWVQQNRSDLAESFKGCDSFLSAEFPPTRTDDDEWERELEEIRAESLEQLERELAKLGRDPVECAILGGFCTMNAASLKRMVMNVAHRASSGLSGVLRSVLQISGLMEDGRFVLVPQMAASSSVRHG